ncbi:imm11 family protein [Hyalangium rubrum]|uniref:Immunity MXAN-0049 protein domain-containing protein n=1 Tax=Hyalangium rubrum TaxID=3103134 RepID=A0ABU5HLM8_9BACT|nr:DUF1629 domain-containing protein [Hyalangium sp. s54d21]MDY7233005.1 hypothetical protein [Hyalangium sp. s54d21]
MPHRYFKLTDDVYITGRWELGEPMDPQGQEVDPWQFTKGKAVHVSERMRVPIKRPGKPLDFSFTSLATPVVHIPVAAMLSKLAPGDAQFIPVNIDSQPDQFCIFVATRLIRCIDEQRSTEVRYWKPEDGRPEKTGQYRSVYRLRIDPSQVGDAKIFRTWGWDIALIVSEEIKEALERLGATGTKFKEV